ncbi:MAG: YidC/Oxa1 family insertase periplasmic-domain containing protein, partial [Planctomycetia bacterium]
MERRYIQFALISFAILFGSQALQAVLFPKKPPVKPADGAAALPADATVAAQGDAPAARATDGAKDQTDTPADESKADAAAPAPRARRTLGSLDPDAPAQMLVTLSSRGAAVERIELAGRRFHDQDDWSGYLGHLALEAVGDGCRVGVVGAGTPAAAAGIEAGDVITRVDGTATPDPAALAKALQATKAGRRVPIEVVRAGSPRAVDATLVRRPLEVVRPEYRTAPVDDPDGLPHDPLSFRLSLEARDGKRRSEPLAEIPGLELADRDWTIDPASDAARVRFTTRLPNGLEVAKTYRLVAAPGGPGYTLELTLEFVSNGRESTITYALDGPTGLPTEGWWYTARVARDWGTLGVRDVAMRFAGEQSTLVSGLKIADAALDHPATAVRDGKPLSFAGVDALYFASALIPAGDGADAPALAEVRPIAVAEPPAAALKKLVDVTPRLVSQELVLAPGATATHRYEIFAGPKRPELLREFGAAGATMDDIVYYGWFGLVARPLIAILHGLHAVIGNYGIAIILLTLMVRGAMFPLSRRQAISSQRMQALQPEMKALAEKYANDPEKRTRATQELWRKHQVNPVSGCLPVFIQIPIFMGLYRSLATDVELRQAPLFSSAIRWCSNL